jgi:hypothetical protein
LRNVRFEPPARGREGPKFFGSLNRWGRGGEEEEEEKEEEEKEGEREEKRRKKAPS